MIGPGIVPGKRHDHAIPDGFGKPSGALTKESRGGVCLLKIRVIRIKDQRFFLLELLAKGGRKPLVPALRHPRRIHGRLIFTRIKMEIEMLGGNDLKVKLLVVDLVAAKILPKGRRDHQGEGGHDQQKKQSRNPGSLHYHLCLPCPTQSPTSLCGPRSRRVCGQLSSLRMHPGAR